MHPASLHSPTLICARCPTHTTFLISLCPAVPVPRPTHAPSLASLYLPLIRSPPPVPLLTLPCSAPLCSALLLTLASFLKFLSLPVPALPLTHPPCLASLSLPAVRSASHTRTMPRFTLLASAPHTCPMPRFSLIGNSALRKSHMHHALLHPALPCSDLLHTHAPCLSSLCLAVIRPKSATCPVPRFIPLAVLHSACHTSATPHFAFSGCALQCSSLMRHASLLSVWLLSAPWLTHAPCFASPCLAVIRSASHTCVMPLFTLLTMLPCPASPCSAQLLPPFIHVHHAPHHPAPPCCYLLPTHAPCLASPC